MSGTLPFLVLLPHAVLMHAPLVLFLLCPVFILVGAVLPPFRGRPWLLGGLLLLGLGTLSLYLHWPGATAGPGVADPTTGTVRWICQSLTTEARIIFVGLTAIFIAVMMLPAVLRQRDNRLFSTVLPLSFLVLYSAGAIFLINATNAAGRVTHELDVPSAAASPGSNTGHTPAE